MPNMRAKFRVNSLAKHEYPGFSLRASAVYPNEQGDAENRYFSEAAPSGTLEIYVTNPGALRSVEPR